MTRFPVSGRAGSGRAVTTMGDSASGPSPDKTPAIQSAAIAVTFSVYVSSLSSWLLPRRFGHAAPRHRSLPS